VNPVAKMRLRVETCKIFDKAHASQSDETQKLYVFIFLLVLPIYIVS
jgi:hypothetical protein